MIHVMANGEVRASVDGMEVPVTHPVYEVLRGKDEEESNSVLGIHTSVCVCR